MTEKRPQNRGTGYCFCIECPYEAEQAEQEPVAWKDLTYGNLHHQDFGNSIPLYAAPVRTKDLTDDEIWEIEEKLNRHLREFPIKLARAVIAADREKNK